MGKFEIINRRERLYTVRKCSCALGAVIIVHDKTVMNLVVTRTDSAVTSSPFQTVKQRFQGIIAKAMCESAQDDSSFPPFAQFKSVRWQCFQPPRTQQLRVRFSRQISLAEFL